MVQKRSNLFFGAVSVYIFVVSNSFLTGLYRDYKATKKYSFLILKHVYESFHSLDISYDAP